jgi:proteasome accessory factor C
MAEHATASQQLERILYLLPSATRGEGVSLAELATKLGVERRQLLRDLEAVTAREFYHPAGSGDEIQVGVLADRVQIWTKGEFRRPDRLNAREALALGLGLRALAAEAGPERGDELRTLAQRLESELARVPAEALQAAFALQSGDTSEEALRLRLLDASRERRCCRIRYLKPGMEAPDERVVCPYVLVFTTGRWYLLAHCRRSTEVRAFRMDRILAVAVTEEACEPPADFDPAHHLSGGYVYRAERETEVVVRYSAGIARWVREFGPIEEQEDGSVLLRHRVADPQWVVRHVLQFGRDAEVIEPPAIRDQVAAAARQFLA